MLDVVTLNPLMKSFLAGSVSGTCSIILFQPLDLVKTKIQLAAGPVNGIAGQSPAFQTTMWNVGKSVVQTDSIRGLWRGFVPSFLRCVPGVGMYFSSLHWLKSHCISDEKPTQRESMILGATARTFTTVCMLPMTVIKTRFESGHFNYRTVGDALRKIYLIEGRNGLYKGIAATLIRDAPFSGIYLSVYNTIKSAVPNQGPVINFGCGIVAGATASIITQPADVIKTRMQVSKTTEVQSVMAIMKLVYKESGWRGFFRGIVPRVTRRTLVAAMAWTIYEQVALLLKL